MKLGLRKNTNHQENRNEKRQRTENSESGRTLDSGNFTCEALKTNHIYIIKQEMTSKNTLWSGKGR